MICFWRGDAGFEAICICLGLPGFAAMAYCVLSAHGFLRCLPEVLVPTERNTAPLKSAYGMLLDVSDVSVDVDRVIESWVMRGTAASLVYATMLLALAVTTVLHMNAGMSITFAIDGLEAFLMFVCKITVGAGAHHVHRRLSHMSRAVAGHWVLVVALAMDAMAVCALALAVVYVWAEVEVQRRSGDYCSPGYVFCWSLILSMVFQSCAAFALYRIQERAELFVADRRFFSNIVGSHWSVLVCGTFGVGAGLWLVGALFVFSPSRSLAPERWTGLFYFLAAGSQLMSGLSMLSINVAVRKYFASPQGKASLAAVAEMVSKEQGDVIGLCSGS
mmetsp:Transcript_32950/g.102762  ORF Transcript_32950/g.102762 Transcript_32950/m.102762 type:complete len:332 (+) Transcript_32950:3-998(+)